jgi:hypothetical protein
VTGGSGELWLRRLARFGTRGLGLVVDAAQPATSEVTAAWGGAESPLLSPVPFADGHARRPSATRSGTVRTPAVGAGDGPRYELVGAVRR